MGPEPIHQAQHIGNGLQACCQLLHAMGLEPIRTDSMNATGLQAQWHSTVPCLCGPTAKQRQATRQMATPDVCETHTPWTLGQWSLRIALCQQASQRSATATCNAGKQSTTLHKPGVVSRVPCSPHRAAA